MVNTTEPSATASVTENDSDMDRRLKKIYFRILSLDGGGVYGIYTALMLKQICDHDENFLNDGSVNLFAGCSAGALTSLLLAMHENPRDALMEGSPQRLLSEPMVYANLNPVNFLKSCVGLGPVFGTKEYYGVLERYFGDITLGELKHNVMITTFNWAGGKAGKWRPKYYNNFRESDPDYTTKVTDVAFAATSPSFYRAIWNGCQDGAWYTSNPTMCAIAEVISEIFSPEEATAAEMGAFTPSGVAHIFLNALEAAGHNMAEGADFNRDTILDLLSVFSVSTGDEIPNLPVKKAEWGMLRWIAGMWNGPLGQWISPTMRGLQPPSQATCYQAQQLLNRKYIAFEKTNGDRTPVLKERISHEGYYRLAPEVLRDPILLVTLLSRNNPLYLRHAVNKIVKQAYSQESRAEIEKAITWLTAEKWFAPDYWIKNAVASALASA